MNFTWIFQKEEKWGLEQWNQWWEREILWESLDVSKTNMMCGDQHVRFNYHPRRSNATYYRLWKSNMNYETKNITFHMIHVKELSSWKVKCDLWAEIDSFYYRLWKSNMNYETKNITFHMIYVKELSSSKVKCDLWAQIDR